MSTENTEMTETEEVAGGLTIAEICRRSFDNAEKHGFHEAQGEEGSKFATLAMLCVTSLARAVEADRQDDEELKPVFLADATLGAPTLEAGLLTGRPGLFDTQAMLMVTEIVEAVDGYYRGDMDNVAEELADVIIRIGDTAVGLGLDLDAAIVRKLEANEKRPHLHGGKKY